MFSFARRLFAHASVDKTDHSQGIVLVINTETDVMTIGGQAELVALFVQKLYKKRIPNASHH